MKKFTKRILTLVLTAALMCCFVCTAASAAPDKPLRVGFFSFDGYHIQSANGAKSGYGYDYLQHLAVYGDWTYEYVGYNDQWSDMLELLRNGEIDLVTSASKTESRLLEFDYSEEPIGYAATIVTVRSGLQRKYADGYDTWNGMRVGLLKGNSRNVGFSEFASAHNFEYTGVYFDDQSELVDELKHGTAIDAAVTSNLRAISDESIIAKFDSSPFYIITRKGSGLMSRINQANEQLLLQEPDLYSTLWDKYYSAQNRGEIAYTAEELAFIDEMQGKAFTAIINPDRDPLSYFQDGRPRGIISEIAAEIIKRSGLNIRIEYVSDRAAYMRRSISQGTDIKFDAWYDLYQAESDGYKLTMPYIEAGVSRVMLKDSDRSVKNVAALNNSDLTENFVRVRFTKSQTAYYNTVDEMVNAVLSGNQDAAYMYSRVAEHAVYNDATGRLISERVYGADPELCIAVRNDRDKRLLSILSKAAASISASDVDAIIERNIANETKPFSIVSYFYDNPLVVVCAVVLFFALICIVIINRNRLYKLKLRRQEERVRLTEIDDKTGLYNKQTFYSKAHELMKKNPERHYTIVRFDIDRFKVYNDIFGPAEGDRALKTIGDHCAGCGALLCAHIDADHFALCTDASELNENELVQKTSAMLMDLNPSFHFTPRFGGYRVDDVDLDVSLMCDRALLAIKSIKGDMTRSFAWFDDAMREDTKNEQLLLSQTVTALRRGEFGIYLQPQYDLFTGNVTGAEALVRWFHPEKGVLAPGTFINVMEKNGLISELDETVWHKAAKLIHDMTAMGLAPAPISVNVSRRDLYDPGLEDKLTAITERYSVPKEMFHLEITESAYMSNPTQLIDVVKSLRKAGFFVEMDDFGSGYSSLNTLKEVPVDRLKLDMNFISGESNSASGGIILSSVVRMAQWLGLYTIAEGVETVSQAEYLKSVGCRLVQGYLYSRPMSTEDYIALMRGAKTSKKLPEMDIDSYFSDGDFWSVDSTASAVFNTLVGAAGIFEYQEGNLECIRVNAKFIETTGLTWERIQELRDTTLSYVHEDSRLAVARIFEMAASTGEEYSADSRWLTPSADTDEKWYHVRIRRIARSANRIVFYVALEDITKRKQLELEQKETLAALKAENESNRALMIRTGLSIYSYSVDADEFVLQHRDKVHTGIEKHAEQNYLSSVKDASFIYPDDCELVTDALLRAQQEKKSGSFECRVDRDGAGYRWLRVHYTPASDETGRVVRITGQIEDIQSERGYSDDFTESIDKNPSYVYIVDPDSYEIAYCNAMGRTIQPYVHGETCHKVLLRRDTPCDGCPMRLYTNTGKPQTAQIMRPDGMWLLTQATPIRWKNEKKMMLVCTDITEQKNAEEALRLSEDELRLSMEQVDRTVCRFDVESRTLTLPQGYARLRRLSPVMTGMPQSVINEGGMDEDTQHAYSDFFREILRGEKKGMCELRLEVNGEKRWLRAEFESLFDHADRPARAVIAVKDVTELHEQSDKNRLDRIRLFTALKSAYPFALSVDLTNDVFSVMHDEFENSPLMRAGSYDRMLKLSTAYVKRELRDTLMSDLSRERLIQKRLAGSESVRTETFSRFADGTWHWLEIIVRFLDEEECGAVLCVILIRSIDEQKVLEDQLKAALDVTSSELEREKFSLKLVNDNIIAGTMIYNVNDISISHLGGNLLQTFGYSDADVEYFKRNGLSSIMPDDDFAHVRESAIMLRQKKPPYFEQEFRLRKKNGDIAWVLRKFTLTRDALGERVYVAIMLDITQRRNMESQLRMNGRFMTLVSTLSDRIVFRLDIKNRTLTALSEEASSKAGFAPVYENMPESVLDAGRVMPESVETFRRLFDDIYSGALTGSAKLRFKTRSSEVSRWFEIRFAGIKDDAGNTVTAVISCLDINDQHDKEIAYARYVTNVKLKAEDGFGFLQADLTDNTAEERVGALLPESLDITSFSYTSLIEYALDRYFSDDEYVRARTWFARDHLLELANKGTRSISDDWNVHFGDGSEHWVHVTLQFIVDPYSSNIKLFITIKDITNEKRKTLDVLQRAETDGMTGIYNRETAERLIKKVLESSDGTRCLLLQIDLDDLKHINDTLGHAEGDRALKAVAKLLKDSVRATDIVGRTGGDEFMVLLVNVNEEMRMEKLLETLINKSHALRVGEDDSIPLGISIGAAVGVSGETAFDTLYRCADKALYKTKSAGKNGYAFYSEN